MGNPGLKVVEKKKHRVYHSYPIIDADDHDYHKGHEDNIVGWRYSISAIPTGAGDYYVGSARTSLQDQFSRKIGRKISIGRALNSKSRIGIYEIKSTEEFHKLLPEIIEKTDKLLLK